LTFPTAFSLTPLLFHCMTLGPFFPYRAGKALPGCRHNPPPCHRSPLTPVLEPGSRPHSRANAISPPPPYFVTPPFLLISFTPNSPVRSERGPFFADSPTASFSLQVLARVKELFSSLRRTFYRPRGPDDILIICLVNYEKEGSFRKPPPVIFPLFPPLIE